MWYKLAGTALASISSVLLLVSIATDYWTVIYDVKARAHWGLWQMCSMGKCQEITSNFDYINSVRGCLIFSAVLSIFALLGAISSFANWRFGPITGALMTSVFSFFTALFDLIAMAVYSSETPGMVTAASWGYAWSFFLGWTALPLLIIAGILLLFAHNSPNNYESL
ncbi:lens fiber membrane intrinsic protein-like [Rhinatrema bivittatum]|uniref:lens fiber membrane intrinsic protein-like n=1 Tax=Rhinatrema bivittatum TaxID=194408 RepID=UPI00112D4AF5|nr:lens fiber membrane intrinsic protein-like [Rhinatrema bivittatum]